MNHATSLQLVEALRALGWIDIRNAHKCAADLERAALENPTSELCIVRSLLHAEENRSTCLTSAGRRTLSRLLEYGISLRLCWPCEWTKSIEQWLGQRLFLTHAANFSHARRLASVVSSRLGSHGSQLPAWPQLVNSALRHIHQRGDQLLVAPGTTASECLEQFSRSAQIPLLQARWSPHADLVSWLKSCLGSLADATQPLQALAHTLDISPPVDGATPDAICGPLQDRISIALADSVHALMVRPGGKVEMLLQRRLVDPSFPAASIFVAMGGASRRQPPSANAQWLDRGAVGWWVWARDCEQAFRRIEPESLPARCLQPRSIPVTQQLCSPIPSSWEELEATADWPYLCHCTRGLAGPLPGESMPQYRDRLWRQEKSTALQPFETLARICAQRVLIGTSAMTRTASKCVSFSAVPLLPLLRRRVFRSHLGRWDWEPFGLLIRLETLRSMGAQPVVYGDEADYAVLPPDQRTYFQPYGKRDSRCSLDWSAEREWRMLGDLSLARLPVDAVRVFVRERHQAVQLSRNCPWPVFWIGDP